MNDKIMIIPATTMPVLLPDDGCWVTPKNEIKSGPPTYHLSYIKQHIYVCI